VFFYSIPIIYLATLFPLTINGIGIREWLFLYFFSANGLTKEILLFIAIINYSLLYGIGLIGALMYFFDHVKTLKNSGHHEQKNNR
jgi:hypothetical protein